MGMMFGKHRLWQVSIVPIGRPTRAYHVFSSLRNAVHFVKIHTMTCVEETGQPNPYSMNIMPYNRFKDLPKVIDEKPFAEWCKENKYRVPNEKKKTK